MLTKKTRKKENFGSTFIGAKIGFYLLFLTLFVLLYKFKLVHEFESVNYKIRFNGIDISSPFFIGIVFPILYFLSFILKKTKDKNNILFIFTIILYSIYNPYYGIILIFIYISVYIFGILVYIDKVKKNLYQAINTYKVGVTLLFIITFIMGVFPSLLESLKNNTNLEAPYIPVISIGMLSISLMGFSYLYGITYKDDKVEENFIILSQSIGNYLCFFIPPVTENSTFRETLKNRKMTLNLIGEGFKSLLYGLFKIYILSEILINRFQLIIKYIIRDGRFISAFLGASVYIYYLYYTLGGYSNITLGLMRILGFNMKEDFLPCLNHNTLSKIISSTLKNFTSYIESMFSRKRMFYLFLGISLIYIFPRFTSIIGTIILITYLIVEGELKRIFSKGIGRIFGIIISRITILIVGVFYSNIGIINVLTFLKSFFFGNGLSDENSLYLTITTLPVLLVCFIESKGVFSNIYKNIRRKIEKTKFKRS